MRDRSVTKIMNNLKYGSFTKGIYGWIEDSRFGRISYDSSYERDRIIQLEKDENIFMVSRCRDMIPYVDLFGKLRNYNPDLRIDFFDSSVVVEEIKPFCMIPKINNPIKAKAANSFYENKEIDFRIVTEKEIYGKL
jgi:hypothetical protein